MRGLKRLRAGGDLLAWKTEEYRKVPYKQQEFANNEMWEIRKYIVSTMEESKFGAPVLSFYAYFLS